MLSGHCEKQPYRNPPPRTAGQHPRSMRSAEGALRGSECLPFHTHLQHSVDASTGTPADGDASHVRHNTEAREDRSEPTRAFGKPREFKPEDADDNDRTLAPDFARLTTDEWLTLRALLC